MAESSIICKNINSLKYSFLKDEAMKNILKQFLLLLAVICLFFVNEDGSGRHLKKSEILSLLSKARIPFIENRGQIDNSIKYYVQTFGCRVLVTDSGEIIYTLPGSEPANPDNGGENDESVRLTNSGLTEKLVNGELTGVEGKEKNQAVMNFFRGRDESGWKRNVPSYNTISYGEVYKGIEFQFRAYGGNIEKLFLIDPGAKPENIRIQMNGAKSLIVNRSGELEAETDGGLLSFTRPVAYQEHNGKKSKIPVKYVVDKNEYGFEVGNYDTDRLLVIDPLISSTFVGGSGIDDRYEPSITLDREGNVYITGFTYSQDFPTTTGAYRTDFTGGSTDRFVSKFSSDLSTLIASTFLGGMGDRAGFVSGEGAELGHAIDIDQDGNVFLAGYTESSDFPVTSGSFDESYNGGREVYISKLSGDLSSLLASTFVGGSGDEGYKWPRIDMTLSRNGDVFVAGLTHSMDFPTSQSAYDDTYNGGPESGDGFIVKLNNGLTELLASTFVGGSENEWRLSIALNSSEDVFLCGETESSDFPTTRDVYDRSFNVMKDIFISKFSHNLSHLKASTFFGGSKLEEALALEIDGDGGIYIAGYTESQDFPTTQNAYSREWAGGDRDAYIARFDTNLRTLHSSTLLGGVNREMCRDLALDKEGNVYVTGNTASSDFPVTAGAFSTGELKRNDIFVSKFSAGLDRLLVSSYFGGSSEDAAFCLTFDSKGYVYLAGFTLSQDFPATSGAYDNSYNGGINDCFIMKFDNDLSNK